MYSSVTERASCLLQLPLEYQSHDVVGKVSFGILFLSAGSVNPLRFKRIVEQLCTSQIHLRDPIETIAEVLMVSI